MLQNKRWYETIIKRKAPNATCASRLSTGTGGRTWTGTGRPNGFWVRHVCQFHHTGEYVQILYIYQFNTFFKRIQEGESHYIKNLIHCFPSAALRPLNWCRGKKHCRNRSTVAAMQALCPAPIFRTTLQKWSQDAKDRKDDDSLLFGNRCRVAERLLPFVPW